MAEDVQFAGFVKGLRAVGPVLADAMIVLERTPSTNDYGRHLLEMVPSGARPTGSTLVIAWEQTSGRGREGRNWWSPPGGGLYASLLMEIEAERHIQTLPLAVGVGLCAGLRKIGAGCELKWPNDLVAEGGKLGGMLIEVVTPGEGPAVAIIGFGVNLGGDRETLEELGATSIENLVTKPPTLVDLATGVVRELLGALKRMDASDGLINEYRQLVVHREGDALTWKQGGNRVRGRFAGVNEQGFLRLDTAEGPIVLSAGEVIG